VPEWLVPLWTPLAGALAAGVVGLLTLLPKWGRSRVRKRKAGRVEAGFVGIHRTYELLSSILHQTTANRVLLLKCENGGGVPGPMSEVYSSVLIERHDDRIDSVADKWQRIQVDGWYAQLMSDIIRHGHAVRRTMDMSEESALRAVYEAQGVDHSEVFHLATVATTRKGGAVFYLSANFRESACQMTPRERMVLTGATSQLRDLIGEFHEVLDYPRAG